MIVRIVTILILVLLSTNIGYTQDISTEPSISDWTINSGFQAPDDGANTVQAEDDLLDGQEEQVDASSTSAESTDTAPLQGAPLPTRMKATIDTSEQNILWAISKDVAAQEYGTLGSFLLGIYHYQQALDALGNSADERRDIQKYNQSIDKAAFYFRLSSLGGFPAAKYLMSHLHYSNIGGFKLNPTAGLSWLEDAIAASDTNAMLTLGSLLLEGRILPKDPYLAIDLFENAYEFGHPDAIKYFDWVENELHNTRQEQYEWILGQPLQNYTIKLQTSLDEARLRQFLIDNPNLQYSAAYRTISNLWDIVDGSYSRSGVDIAIQNRFGGILPSGVSKRSFTELRDDVLPTNPVYGTQDVLDADPRQYTVWLAQFPRWADAQDFVVFNGLQNAFLVQLKDLSYGVFAGIFNDSDTALSARASLPALLREKSIDVISFETFQASVLVNKIRPQIPYFADEFRTAEWLGTVLPSLNSVANETSPLQNESTGQLLSKVGIPAYQDAKDLAWLSQQNNAAYSVVLFQATTRHQALDMSSFMGLELPIIFKDENRLYNLMSGIFLSEVDANNAIAALPDEMLLLNPFALNLQVAMNSELLALQDPRELLESTSDFYLPETSGVLGKIRVDDSISLSNRLSIAKSRVEGRRATETRNKSNSQELAAFDQWLSTLDENYYTLQLASFTKSSVATAFMKKLSLQDKGQIKMAGSLRGPDLRFFCYGEFSSRELALQTKQLIETSNPSVEPFIRSIKVLKKRRCDAAMASTALSNAYSAFCKGVQ